MFDLCCPQFYELVIIILRSSMYQLDALTAGRLRAETDITGLKSGPIGIRMLCSYASFDVKGKGKFLAKYFSTCRVKTVRLFIDKAFLKKN